MSNGGIPENPDLEDALDGLIAAAKYCDDNGHHNLGRRISRLYQRLGEIELGDLPCDSDSRNSSEMDQSLEEYLAEQTGRDPDEFELPKQMDVPDLDDLKEHDAAEFYDENKNHRR